MAKYSFKFKKKIVLKYLAGEGGYGALARKYKIPSDANIREWVKAYQNLGDKGLTRSRQRKSYSYEYKLAIVDKYITSGLSYADIALAEKISNPSILARWVLDYRAFGPEALRPKKGGLKKTMNSEASGGVKTMTPETDAQSVDTSVEYVRKLEEELLKLRIENAFLKALRRLRLEDEAKMREWQESFTASEDNSN